MDQAALDAARAAARSLPQTELRPVLPSTELHADGDYLAYYFAGNDETSIGAARRNLTDCIQNVERIVGAGGRRIMHLSSHDTTKADRFAIATVKPYQGQRDSGRKPKNWEALRSWLETGDLPKGWGRAVWRDREADDGVAAACRFAIASNRLPGIFSRDKDFRMIPGLHVDFLTFDTINVPETCWAKTVDGKLFGRKWFWQQLLTGDSADNIPGIPGVGEVAATKLLADAHDTTSAFDVCMDAYGSKYGDAVHDRILEQAALLWLRTDNAASLDNVLVPFGKHAPELHGALNRLEKRIAQIKNH